MWRTRPVHLKQRAGYIGDPQTVAFNDRSYFCDLFSIKSGDVLLPQTSYLDPTHSEFLGCDLASVTEVLRNFVGNNRDFERRLRLPRGFRFRGKSQGSAGRLSSNGQCAYANHNKFTPRNFVSHISFLLLSDSESSNTNSAIPRELIDCWRESRFDSLPHKKSALYVISPNGYFIYVERKERILIAYVEFRGED